MISNFLRGCRKVKLFIKADAGILYSEYEVKSWGLNDKGIEVILTK